MPSSRGPQTGKRPFAQPSPETSIGVTFLYYSEDPDFHTTASMLPEVHQQITQFLPTPELVIRLIKSGFAADCPPLPAQLGPPLCSQMTIQVQGTPFYAKLPGCPKPATKKAKPASLVPPVSKPTSVPAKRSSPATIPAAVSTVSEDDFTEADMMESDGDDSFSTPPPSDDESETRQFAAILPQLAGFEKLTQRAALETAHAKAAREEVTPRAALATASTPVADPVDYDWQLPQNMPTRDANRGNAFQRPKPTTQGPRARRHPALQKPLPARDLQRVTILVRPRDLDASLHKIGFKALARALSQFTPVPISWRRIFGHGLALDFPQGTPTAPLLELTSFAEVRVTASLPTARRTRSGTVRGPYSSPEEVRELYIIHDSNPLLQEVERIGKSNVFRLTFADASLPETVIILYNTHRVTPFFTRPVRCFNCHRLNHVAKACRSKLTCGKCAKPGHAFKDCPAPEPKCPNCGGPHNSADRNCSHWQYELRIRKTVAREDIPLPQARAAAAKSYAEALKERQLRGRPTKPAEPQQNTSQPTRSPSFSAEAFISAISKVLEICISNIATPDAIQAKVGTFLESSLGLTFPQ